RYKIQNKNVPNIQCIEIQYPTQPNFNAKLKIIFMAIKYAN
ncbi:unnamed protein product, partial [Rotaria socialis]